MPPSLDPAGRRRGPEKASGGAADPAIMGRWPPCTDGVVTLREYRSDDVDEMVVMCRDPEAVRYTTVPDPYERADAERWITEAGQDQGTQRSWAIEAADDTGAARFAGNIDIRTGPPRTSAICSRPGPGVAG